MQTGQRSPQPFSSCADSSMAELNTVAMPCLVYMGKVNRRIAAEQRHVAGF